MMKHIESIAFLPLFTEHISRQNGLESSNASIPDWLDGWLVFLIPASGFEQAV